MTIAYEFMSAAFPPFDETVADGGYRWWYVDAISNDGAHAITLILFIGSVFSPYYAWARKKGPTPAARHCALNVALYGRPWRWCMTERGGSAQQRGARHFHLGPSTVMVAGEALSFEINERAMPWPTRVQGAIRVQLPAAHGRPVALDSSARHHWQPLAPCTRIEVNMSTPALSWCGSAYVDSNWGEVPLESSFRFWQWTRAHLPGGETAVLYDIENLHGQASRHSLRLRPDGSEVTAHTSGDLHTGTEVRLPSTRWWRMSRSVRATPGARVSELVTLEDTPFYSRSRFHTSVQGLPAECMHESLDLRRFDHPVTRCLLPFRMPRRTRWPYRRSLVNGPA